MKTTDIVIVMVVAMNYAVLTISYLTSPRVTTTITTVVVIITITRA